MKRIGKNIKNKISNNRGVSILFALMLFLVVSLVSIAIIVASSSSIKRTNSSKISEQYNLATESAALMIKDDLSNKEVTYTYSKKNGYSLGNSSAKIFTNEQKSISSNILSNNFSDMSSFTIETGNENIKDVKVTPSIKLSDGSSNVYIVTFKLECVDGSSTSLSTIYEKFYVTNENNKLAWTYYMSNNKDF